MHRSGDSTDCCSILPPQSAEVGVMESEVTTVHSRIWVFYIFREHSLFITGETNEFGKSYINILRDHSLLMRGETK